MTNEIIETAKATQELAKTTGKAIEATQKLGGFVAKTIAEPIEATVGILTDKLRFMRWERQLRLVDRCNEIIKIRNLEGETRIVAPKLALPIIQNASLEENDSLQDLWANLLVTAMDHSQETPRSAYIHIIEQLESIDVKMLEFIYSKYTQKKNGKSYLSAEYIPIFRRDIQTYCDIDDNVYMTAIDNLIRVRLVASFIEDSGVDTKDDDDWDTTPLTIHHGYSIISITCLGVSFIRACTNHD